MNRCSTAPIDKNINNINNNIIKCDNEVNNIILTNKNIINCLPPSTPFNSYEQLDINNINKSYENIEPNNRPPTRQLPPPMAIHLQPLQESNRDGKSERSVTAFSNTK